MGPPDMGSLSLEQQVGQLVIARYQDWPLMEKLAKRGLISGMTPSITRMSPGEVAEFTNRFQRLSPLPLLFGWGGVSYSGGTEVRLNQAMRLGATRNGELCRAAARIEAREARSLGFHLAGTPVLDVNLNPDNTIINLRSLGDSVELVTALGGELARGTLEGGAAPICMHFPGHGATRGDSHIEMPVAERSLAELESVELRPFAELIKRGLARVICTNHCHYPALEPDGKLPATLSRKIVTDLLRKRLGHEWVIMSDSLTMRPIKDNYGIEEAAIGAVVAGHDLILQDYNSDPIITIEALARAVRLGRIPMEQIEASIRRVWRLKQDLGLFSNRLTDAADLGARFPDREGAAVAQRIAREGVTLLENAAGCLSADAGPRVLVISNGSAATVDQDNAVRHSPANDQLNRSVMERAPRARSLILSTTMGREEIGRALEESRAADIVIFGLFTRVRAYVEDAIRIPAPYRELIGRVVAEGKSSVLLNFGNPYVMADLPRAGYALCTFSDAKDSIDAAIAALFGELKPKGRLPVRISDRYPFGHGLEG